MENSNSTQTAAPSPAKPNPTPSSPFAPNGEDKMPGGGLNVNRAFGKPITAQGRTIIPVALVAAMGTGGGIWSRMGGMLRKAPANGPMDGSTNGPMHGPMRDPINGASRGRGGMRRRMMVRPVGYIDVSSTGSRFVPIAPGRFVVLGIVLAFVAGGLIRRSRAKRKANG